MLIAQKFDRTGPVRSPHAAPEAEALDNTAYGITNIDIGKSFARQRARATDLDGLVALALPRLDALIGEGVSTIEVKSGYGLDRETELNMLRAARRLAQLLSLIHI